MRKVLILAVVLVVASLIIAAGPAVTPDCVISWNQNTESDLAGYTVFVTQTRGAYGPGVPVSAPFVSITCEVAGVNQVGQWFVTVSAFDTSGNQSAKATEYPFFVQIPPPPDTTPPGVPTGLVVQ